MGTSSTGTMYFSKKQMCKWSTEGDPDITIWHETNCGESFYSDSGDYKEIGFKWCPYCGKEIYHTEEVRN